MGRSDWNDTIHLEMERLKREGRFRFLESELPPTRSFCHNDYLGLSSHPGLLDSARRHILELNGGSRGSRLLGGNQEILSETERRIADYFGSPQAVLFSSGYLANQAVVTAMSQFAGRIYCDEKIHASLIDGTRLSGKPKTIVPHNQWNEISDINSDSGTAERSLMIAESLYSMDGDTLNVSSALDFQRKQGAFFILDEAHAVGVLDQTGLGLSAPYRDFNTTAVTITFGKAFGVSGAAVLCSEAVKSAITNFSRSFIFTTAPSPWTAALILASLQCMAEEGASRRSELWDRARLVREYFSQSGLPLVDGAHLNAWDKISPILPLNICGNDRALRFALVMREFSWSVRAIRYPTVPVGSERIRVSLNLQVSRSDTLEFAEQVVKQWKVFS